MLERRQFSSMYAPLGFLVYTRMKDKVVGHWLRIISIGLAIGGTFL